VGALCMLGVFLVLDGRAPSLFPTVEGYAKSATWGVVAAVPILVMAYVLGLFLSSAAVLAVHAFAGPGIEAEATDLARIASLSAEKSAAVQYYVQLRQDRAAIAGSSIAFVVLAAGALSELSNLPHIKGSVVVLALGALALAGVLFWLAENKTAEAHHLAVRIAEQLPSASQEKK
jgi:hypothetical protein